MENIEETKTNIENEWKLSTEPKLKKMMKELMHQFLLITEVVH